MLENPDLTEKEWRTIQRAEEALLKEVKEGKEKSKLQNHERKMKKEMITGGGFKIKGFEKKGKSYKGSKKK